MGQMKAPMRGVWRDVGGQCGLSREKGQVCGGARKGKRDRTETWGRKGECGALRGPAQESGRLCSLCAFFTTFPQCLSSVLGSC